jgi:hypothetical protein
LKNIFKNTEIGFAAKNKKKLNFCLMKTTENQKSSAKTVNRI